MEMQEIWMPYYDNKEFKEKLNLAEDRIHRYGICDARYAKEVITDCGIVCGFYEEMNGAEVEETKQWIKIPFAPRRKQSWLAKYFS